MKKRLSCLKQKMDVSSCLSNLIRSYTDYNTRSYQKIKAGFFTYKDIVMGRSFVKPSECVNICISEGHLDFIPFFLDKIESSFFMPFFVKSIRSLNPSMINFFGPMIGGRKCDVDVFQYMSVDSIYRMITNYKKYLENYTYLIGCMICENIPLLEQALSDDTFKSYNIEFLVNSIKNRQPYYYEPLSEKIIDYLVKKLEELRMN